MRSSRYRTLLRSLFGAIVRTDLSPHDLRALSAELRRGRLADELAYMIDQVSEHFQDPEREISDGLRELERLVRANKVSKATLSNIITSIDSRPPPPNSANIRRILQEFLSSASAWQIDKLRDTLSATSGPDPYLKGISEKGG